MLTVEDLRIFLRWVHNPSQNKLRNAYSGILYRDSKIEVYTYNLLGTYILQRPMVYIIGIV